MNWQQRYQEKFYWQQPNWVNGTKQFHDVIAENLPANANVLELGSGPGNRTTKYLSERSASVDGLDIDPQVQGNEFLNRAIVYDGKEFPLDDATYDAVVADYVLEHVEEPYAVFSEISRVLKPGGVFLFRTPNLFHYVSLISLLTPHFFHIICRKFLRGSNEGPDPYPTFYRLNSARRIRRICREMGLEAMELKMVEKEPSYLLFSRPAFLAGLAYERLVNSSNWFRSLRVNIFGVIRRDATIESQQYKEQRLQQTVNNAA